MSISSLLYKLPVSCVSETASLLGLMPSGESLVSGMIPGSAIAFKANKAHLDSPEVLCYASKSEGMFVRESLIFRSDSNGEDLDGYAGRKCGYWGVKV